MEENHKKEEYILNRKLEIELKSIEDMNKYNSVVCSIGYISLLAILCYTHELIAKNFIIWSCLFFSISVSIFVIFEMIKVFINDKYNLMVLENLEEYNQNKIDKKTLVDKIIFNKEYCYKNFVKNQKLFFIPSATFGFLSALFILLGIVSFCLKNILCYLITTCR